MDALSDVLRVFRPNLAQDTGAPEAHPPVRTEHRITHKTTAPG